MAYIVINPHQLEFSNGIDIEYARVVYQAYEIHGFDTKVVSKAFSESYIRLKIKIK